MPLKEDDLFWAVFGAVIGLGAAIVKWINGNRKTPAKLFTLVIGSAFWGFASAWAITSMFPDWDIRLVGVAIAVLSHMGTEATVQFLKERFGLTTSEKGKAT